MWFQPMALCDGNMAAERVIYVDAWPQVGRRVRLVEGGYQICKDIVSGHDIRSETMPVGPQCGNQEKHGHTGAQKNKYSEVIFSVVQEKVSDHNGDICEPQHVRNHEYFTERNHVIKGYMDDLIASRDGLLQMPEPQQIYDSVEHQWNCVYVFCIPYFLPKSFHHATLFAKSNCNYFRITIHTLFIAVS